VKLEDEKKNAAKGLQEATAKAQRLEAAFQKEMERSVSLEDEAQQVKRRIESSKRQMKRSKSELGDKLKVLTADLEKKEQDITEYTKQVLEAEEKARNSKTFAVFFIVSFILLGGPNQRCFC